MDSRYDSQNIMEIMEAEIMASASLSPTQHLCDLHLEKLNLFCQNHEKLVCHICRNSEVHRNHTITSIDEAAVDLREKLQRSLDPLNNHLRGLHERKDQFATAAAHIRAQALITEMQIMAEFRRLHQFLHEEESVRLEAVTKEEQQKTKNIVDKMDIITQEIATLTDTIRATEEQLQANNMSFLSAYKGAINSVRHCVLKKTPKLGDKTLLDQARHVGNMGFHIWQNMKEKVNFSPVILDPNTAHPELIMSADLCSVGQTRRLVLPQNPERCKYNPRVLGWEGFSQGSHSWTVKVPDDTYWAIGVISESVLGGQRIQSGFWDICVTNGNYKAYAGSSSCKVLQVKRKVDRVRVKLSFSKGKLSFYNADTKKVIHKFTHAFRGRLFPYFETHSDVKVQIERIERIENNIA